MTKRIALLSTGNSFEVGSHVHQIVERIHAAVMEQRLVAGTKLNKAQICDTFGAGRMWVRRALLLLASQGIVQSQANRGTVIACTDPERPMTDLAKRLCGV